MRPTARRPNPPPPAYGLLPLHRVEGEKRRVYNILGKEVTLPHLMGKGWGWGFCRRQTLARCDFNQPMGGGLEGR